MKFFYAESDRTDFAHLAILLHGFGSDEQDLLGLAPYFPPAWKVLSVRAPHDCPFGGYAWFDIEFSPDGAKSCDFVQAEQSAAFVREIVSELRTQYPGLPTLLGGFSQGAMMSLASGADVDRLWLASGCLLPFLKTPPKCPVLVQHGVMDPMIPVKEANKMADWLDEGGASYEYREYPMAHTISEASLTDFLAWLASD